MSKEHIFPIRIYHQDTDMLGMVHHANHIKFMERARSEWLLEQGIDLKDLHQQEIYFVIHSIQINYLKPIRFHDKIEIVTEMKRVGKVSIKFLQTFRAQENKNIIYCVADVKLACLDRNEQPYVINFLK
jgi:acyl-CoA thioester hydrolase